jgi:hypothetical protein
LLSAEGKKPEFSISLTVRDGFFLNYNINMTALLESFPIGYDKRMRQYFGGDE